MSEYPTSDEEVAAQVRALTLYDDTSDELDQAHLRSLLSISKMRLETKTGVSDFYTDGGMGQALVGMTAVLAKTAVENYSVDSWDIGTGSIDVSGSGDGGDVQFQQWANMVAEGLRKAETKKSSTATNINSASYIG